jgi:hypothetical protein
VTELENDGLPPWPQMPAGWDFDVTAIVPRRTSALFVGAIVFVHTSNRVYRKRWNGTYHAGVGGPVERYTYEVRKIAGETRVSWLLAAYNGADLDRCYKVPKRDLSKIYGRDDVEDALWIGSHQHKIARAVGDLRDRGLKTRAQLEAIAQILGMETGK